MAKGLKKSQTWGSKKSKLITRLLLPMLFMVVLQSAIFWMVLIFGGEFTYVTQYAYNTLVEKTESRKNYIENTFQEKVPFVQETAVKINDLVADLLDGQGASISALQTDKDLNRQLMESAMDPLVDLMRRSAVDDAYFILDTGNLYGGNGGSPAKAALYLRDLDTSSDAGYQDLLMELGFTFIAQKYGIVLDSGWSLHFESDPQDGKNYGFYYDTIQTAQESEAPSIENLGLWTGFSSFSSETAGSLKYSLPLISEDGTVYGVIGIGLTEKSILTDLPVNDFTNEIACYVLGRRQSNGAYDVVAHSGSAFSQLMGDSSVLQIAGSLGDNVSDISANTDTALVGSVQAMNLYSEDSPYAAEQWALITVADRESVLSPLNNIIQMLIIASVVSIAISIVVMLISSYSVAKPISNTIKKISSSSEYSGVIRFQPSNIYELDKMTDAITQLQINVQDFSSQVSQMIRIADVGLGTFMYDRTNDNIFVGQSLFRLLLVKEERDEDAVMSRQEFLDNIISEETRQTLTEALLAAPDADHSEYSREYSVGYPDGTTRWMRLNLMFNGAKSIGIMQDITGVIMEKQRIEYERDYDSTTGLLNRRAYNQKLAELFNNKAALRTTAIIMLDLDNLKFVNDTHGHDFGDEYIKTAANALRQFEIYGGIVSRLSGDEFNVCLPGFASKDEAREIINEVRGKLLESSCLLADGSHFKIRASAGVAWYPDDARSYEMLMKYADFAMYTIKHSKKGGIAEFDMETYAADSVLLTGVEEVNRIIDERSVRYAFQCIVSAKTGEIYGYEALMRPLSSIFQSHLELLRTAKTGAKLYELECLTWTKALDDFQTQIDAGRIANDSHVFVNSIASCVLDAEDMAVVEAAHRDLLSRVVLEILEIENSNEDSITRKTRRMEQWNAQVALDDFGIGYNSETILAELKPNIIKIDHSIITGCDKDVSRRNIINRLVKLAHARRILVLASGIETAEELKSVVACGVDLLQGYYIGRPLFEPQPVSPDIVEVLKSLAAPKGDSKPTT